MLQLDQVQIRNDGFELAAHWSVDPGQKVAVVGPSGAGKSTLLNAISGFLPLQSGRLRWGGLDITDAAPGERPVAMLFQDGNLFPHLSVAQNVGLGIRPDLRLNKGDQQRVRDALERVGLSGFGDRKPGSLSGGQQSRAALARVLMQARPLLLLDEPFAALGPALKRDMLDLVSELVNESGATLLMVSHDPEDAKHIADLTILVANGRADPPVATGDLFDNPPAALRDYLGQSGGVTI